MEFVRVLYRPDQLPRQNHCTPAMPWEYVLNLILHLPQTWKRRSSQIIVKFVGKRHAVVRRGRLAGISGSEKKGMPWGQAR